MLDGDDHDVRTGAEALAEEVVRAVRHTFESLGRRTGARVGNGDHITNQPREHISGSGNLHDLRLEPPKLIHLPGADVDPAQG